MFFRHTSKKAEKEFFCSIFNSWYLILCLRILKETRPLSLLRPRLLGLVTSMDRSENITPVWAISPHTPAANHYSSCRTQWQWLTRVIFVNMHTLWSVSVKHADCMSMCENICQLFIQEQTEIFFLHCRLTLISLPTLYFLHPATFFAKWKGRRSYWFCSSNLLLSKMH